MKNAIARLIVLSIVFLNLTLITDQQQQQQRISSNKNSDLSSSFKANFWVPAEEDEKATDIDEYDSADNYEEDYDNNAPSKHNETFVPNISTTLASNVTGKLEIVHGLSNVSRETGQSVKLRCEIVGKPLPNNVVWYKNDAPLQFSKRVNTNRIRVKQKIRSTPFHRIQSSLKISNIEIHDKGYYKCSATNGIRTVESTGILFVKTNFLKQNSEETYNTPELASPFSDFSSGLFRM